MKLSNLSHSVSPIKKKETKEDKKIQTKIWNNQNL